MASPWPRGQGARTRPAAPSSPSLALSPTPDQAFWLRRWAGTSAPPLPPSATTPEAATASVPTEGPPTDARTADHHRGLDSPAAPGPPVTSDPLQLHPEVLVGGVSALKWRGRWEWESGHLLEPLVASLPGPRPSGRPPLGPASPPPGTPGLAASPRHLRWWVTWVASSIGDGRREAHRGARHVEWAKRMWAHPGSPTPGQWRLESGEVQKAAGENPTAQPPRGGGGPPDTRRVALGPTRP